MAIIYRGMKGSKLTFTEVDNNFFELKNSVDAKKPNFSILPVSEGGTGTDTAEGAIVSLGIPQKIQNAEFLSLGSVAGTDVISAVATPAISGYSANQTFRFVSVGSNTGAVTLNIDGKGAKSILKSSPAGPIALVANDIPAAGIVLQVTYDGTGFQLISGAGSSGATGGGSDRVFYENGQTVTANYTLTSGKNAGSFGPITISNGVLVTVPNNQTWTII